MGWWKAGSVCVLPEGLSLDLRGALSARGRPWQKEDKLGGVPCTHPSLGELPCRHSSWGETARTGGAALRQPARGDYLIRPVGQENLPWARQFETVGELPGQMHALEINGLETKCRGGRPL